MLYGRCKFGTDCSFLHVTTEDEVTKAIKTIQDEVLSLKTEILSLKSITLDLRSSLNSIKEEIKTVNPDEIESDIFAASSCELCALKFTSEDNLKQHISDVHETIPTFKCDLCDYESKSKKGVKIHRGSKHKSAKPSSTSQSSTSTPEQTPITFILRGDGCPNLLTTYFNKHTAMCPSCQASIKNKLLSSPFPPDLCPCCHQASNGLPYSLCSECLESIQEDGFADSSWGSWHLDRTTGQILCIGLDFD